MNKLDSISTPKPSVLLAGGGCNAPSQVQGQIAELRELVEINAKLIEETENRLGTVIRPIPPASEPSEMKRQEPLVDLADALRKITQRVKYNNEHLESIINRIEL